MLDDRDLNPYAPPASYGHVPYEGMYGDVLAARGTRFVARLVDGMLFMACILPAVIAVAMSPGEGIEDRWLSLAVMAGVPMLGLSCYQWYLISVSGQSLAKKWMDIRIVKLDGSPVDFVSGVLLREWLLGAIGYLPYIGGCIGLVDALWIFGEEQRCLHDLIAGTKVVRTNPWPG